MFYHRNYPVRVIPAETCSIGVFLLFSPAEKIPLKATVIAGEGERWQKWWQILNFKRINHVGRVKQLRSTCRLPLSCKSHVVDPNAVFEI